MAGLEDATEAQIPFIGESVSLTNPAMLLATAVSLIFGFVLFEMAGDIGRQIAARVNAGLASALGTSVGSESGDDSVPGV